MDDRAPAIVWQGFNHRWTYNHRLNRLGDWVDHERREGQTVEGTASHAAASGSGEDADEATWRSFHAAVQAPGVWAHPTVDSFTIGGREGVEQAFVRTLRVQLPEGMHDLERYTVLLN